MIRKTLIALTIFSAAIYNLRAQSVEYKNYDFGDKPPVVTATADELNKNKAIILNELKAKEIVVNSENNLENYLFYSVAILINDVSVIDKFNKIYIPVSDPKDLLTLKCRTSQPNGKSIELFKGDMKTITEDGVEYSILALEGLEKNSIIEYFYLKRVAVTYYLSESLGNKHFVKKYTSKIISPENLVYTSKSYNKLPKAIDTTYNNKNFLIFQIDNLPAVSEEKYTTDREKLPRFEAKLEYNLNNKSKKLFTYADAAKKIVSNYHEKENGDEKIVSKTYKKLNLADIKSTDEKIFTIESYIKNDLGYIEQPGKLTMAECIEKKGLSKFYQYKLAVLLFEKCGIPYELVCTSYKNNQPFDPEFESYSFLDATLFYFPETKKYLVFDNLFYRYGEAPSTLMGQKGLFVKPILIGEVYSAVNSIKYIEPIDGKNNFDNMECDISFKPAENKLNIFTTRTLGGYPACNIRPYYFYYDADKRSELINSLLKNGLENSKVSLSNAQNFDLKDFAKYNTPFIFSGLSETKELTEIAGSDYIIKIGNCIGAQAELYQEEKRQYPIYASYPHSYKRVLNFTIPEGYKIQGLEKLNMNVELKENNASTAGFNSSYKQEGNKVIITVNEFYSKEYYDKENFEGFRKVINAAADFNKVSLLLKK